MYLRFATAAGAVAVAILTAAPALAVTQYNNVATFHGLGAIGQTTNFDAYPQGVGTDLGPTATDGALQLSAADLRVYGVNYSSYGNTLNVLVNDYYAPIFGAVTQTNYNLMSFEIGNLIGARDLTLTVRYFDGVGDNFATFGESLPLTSQGFAFFGFGGLAAGQYFEGFRIESNNTQQDLDADQATAPAIGQIELGQTGSRIGGGCVDTSRVCGGPVPEPSSWALMLIGFGALGAALRGVRQSAAKVC